jgi:hypothetical protein
MTSSCYCKYCGNEIEFDDYHVSEYSGKKIPLDAYPMEPHDFPENPYNNHNRNNRIVEYWTCGEEIIFSDDMVIKKSRKKISPDLRTHKPHECYTDEEKEDIFEKKE